MSKETKIGLLVSLGVILVFAMILSMRMNREGSEFTNDQNGVHTVQNNLDQRGNPDVPSGPVTPAMYCWMNFSRISSDIRPVAGPPGRVSLLR